MRFIKPLLRSFNGLYIFLYTSVFELQFYMYNLLLMLLWGGGDTRKYSEGKSGPMIIKHHAMKAYWGLEA
jgi:hypothetical protein